MGIDPRVPTLSDPTPAGARYEILDVVRGFALFGVLLANMVWTSHEFALTEAQRAALPTAGVDRVLGPAITWLIGGKFYTLFAMLFGLGFAVQLSRAAGRGQNLLPAYVRRLSILFLIGAAHALLLWFGDILHVYALLGFVLILFRDRSDRVLLGAAAVLAAVAALMPFAEWALAAAAPGAPAAGVEAARHAALTAGGPLDIIRVNWEFNRDDYLDVFPLGGSMVQWYVNILWKFLLGFYLGRRRLLQDASRHLAGYRRLFPWALATGLIVNGGWVVADLMSAEGLPDSSSAWTALASVPGEVGVFALAIGYLAGLVLLYHRPAWKGRLGLLAPVGRMALTSYLSQSVFMVALLYDVGLGLLGRIGVAGCVALSVVLFALQIALSAWWLRRFPLGPAEWVWRRFTYGARHPASVHSSPA